jgi:hypothetical protein
LDEKRYIITAYHALMADSRLSKRKRIYLLIIFTGISYYVINSDTVPILSINRSGGIKKETKKYEVRQ